MSRALIVVDVQNDFCEGGSLAVAGGAAVAKKINKYIGEHFDDYQLIVATKDWHINPGSHWSDTPDYIDSWPVHCVATSKGADFHPNINSGVFDAIFKKGQLDAAYSGFEGYDEITFKTLDEYLKACGITDIDVVGIAYDYCVYATAVGGSDFGYNVRVIRDLTAAVDPSSKPKIKKLFDLAAVEEITSYRPAFADTSKWIIFKEGKKWTVTPPAGVDIEKFEKTFTGYKHAVGYVYQMLPLVQELGV